MDYAHSLKLKMELLMRTGDICDGNRSRSTAATVEAAMRRVSQGERPTAVAADLGIHPQTIYCRIARAKKAGQS
jgi:hypothetical protein